MVNLALIDSTLSDCRSPKCAHYVLKTQELFLQAEPSIYLNSFRITI